MEHHHDIVDYLNSKGAIVILLFRRNTLRRLISVLANNYDRRTKQLNGIHKSHVHSKEEVWCNKRLKMNQKMAYLISFCSYWKLPYLILSEKYSILSVPFAWAGWDTRNIQAKDGRVNSDPKHQKRWTFHENLLGPLPKNAPHDPLLRGCDPRQKCSDHKQTAFSASD